MTPRRPCVECPWRRDVARGQFPPERYEALLETRGRRDDEFTGHDAPIDAPWFACHKARPGEEFGCAGWLAVEGSSHVGVRLAVLRGLVAPEALAPADGWPELLSDYDELLRRHGPLGLDG